jgi:hypothetical protein
VGSLCVLPDGTAGSSGACAIAESSNLDSSADRSLLNVSDLSVSVYNCEAAWCSILWLGWGRGTEGGKGQESCNGEGSELHDEGR